MHRVAGQGIRGLQATDGKCREEEQAWEFHDEAGRLRLGVAGNGGAVGLQFIGGPK
jgi:hypothetical protein